MAERKKNLFGIRGEGAQFAGLGQTMDAVTMPLAVAGSYLYGGAPRARKTADSFRQREIQRQTQLGNKDWAEGYARQMGQNMLPKRIQQRQAAGELDELTARYQRGAPSQEYPINVPDAELRSSGVGPSSPELQPGETPEDAARRAGMDRSGNFRPKGGDPLSQMADAETGMLPADQRGVFMTEREFVGPEGEEREMPIEEAGQFRPGEFNERADELQRQRGLRGGGEAGIDRDGQFVSLDQLRQERDERYDALMTPQARAERSAETNRLNAMFSEAKRDNMEDWNRSAAQIKADRENKQAAAAWEKAEKSGNEGQMRIAAAQVARREAMAKLGMSDFDLEQGKDAPRNSDRGKLYRERLKAVEDMSKGLREDRLQRHQISEMAQFSQAAQNINNQALRLEYETKLQDAESRRQQAGLKATQEQLDGMGWTRDKQGWAASTASSWSTQGAGGLTDWYNEQTLNPEFMTRVGLQLRDAKDNEQVETILLNEFVSQYRQMTTDQKLRIGPIKGNSRLGKMINAKDKPDPLV